MIDMAKIGPSKNTRPERIVQMWLVRNGIRHRRHVRGLPGCPDFVVGDVIIFVDGRFWHCPDSKARLISKFWRDKIEANVKRDRRNRGRLRRMNYRTIRIWDSDLKSKAWQARLSRGDIKRCLVYGFEIELGDVSMEEIRPYVIARTSQLDGVLAAPGWDWL